MQEKSTISSEQESAIIKKGALGLLLGPVLGLIVFFWFKLNQSETDILHAILSGIGVGVGGSFVGFVGFCIFFWHKAGKESSKKTSIQRGFHNPSLNEKNRRRKR